MEPKYPKTPKETVMGLKSQKKNGVTGPKIGEVLSNSDSLQCLL